LNQRVVFDSERNQDFIQIPRLETAELLVFDCIDKKPQALVSRRAKPPPLFQFDALAGETHVERREKHRHGCIGVVNVQNPSVQVVQVNWVFNVRLSRLGAGGFFHEFFLRKIILPPVDENSEIRVNVVFFFFRWFYLLGVEVGKLVCNQNNADSKQKQSRGFLESHRIFFLPFPS